jgi:hypothetical protein
MRGCRVLLFDHKHLNGCAAGHKLQTELIEQRFFQSIMVGITLAEFFPFDINAEVLSKARLINDRHFAISLEDFRNSGKRCIVPMDVAIAFISYKIEIFPAGRRLEAGCIWIFDFEQQDVHVSGFGVRDQAEFALQFRLQSFQRARGQRYDEVIPVLWFAVRKDDSFLIPFIGDGQDIGSGEADPHVLIAAGGKSRQAGF